MLSERLSTLRACSHALLASDDVPRMTRFFRHAFGLAPHYENDLFAEFVLPSGFRLAFFKPVGASARTFHATADRGGCALGVTVTEVDEVYRALSESTSDLGIQLSGPPKEHPWGEKSFLLIDPDGNRWEVAKAPSASGMLTDLPS